jgi:hypothetical protein
MPAFERASLALALCLASAVPALAQTAPETSAPEAAATRTAEPAPRRMIDYLINAPHVQNWNTWGQTPAPTPRPAEGVTGGQAIRVTAARAGDPWSVGAIMTNPGPIAAGDVMLAAVWVRKTGPGDASLPLLMLESQTEPKTVIARSADVALGDAWTLVYASGTAPTAFGAGETALILHLGRDAGTLEIGPGLLFDMGADYDVARLPTNPPAP